MPKTNTSQSTRESNLSSMVIFNAVPKALETQVNETVSPVAMSLVVDPHFQFGPLYGIISILRFLRCLPVNKDCFVYVLS